MGVWKNGGRQPWVDAPQDDGEVWLTRTCGNADHVLVKASREDAYIIGHRVYVRTRELANKLDRGLVIR